MTSGRTPGKVVVNEIVELAKHFSTEKAPAFVNALLDKVMKRVSAIAAPAATSEPSTPDAP
jgi:transcription termination factor NusB